MHSLKLLLPVLAMIFCCLTAFAEVSYKEELSSEEQTASTLIENGKDAEASMILRPLADKGRATAQNLLGEMYRLQKDYAAAAKWYGMAAKQGNARAQNNMGRLYTVGHGVNKDDKEAAAWFRKAAEQGFAKAQNNLSVMYSTGRGVPKDPVEASNWCKKAAENSDPTAMANLAERYKMGVGVTKNLEESLKWFKRAAENNLARAQIILGSYYQYGEQVPKDLEAARKWYGLAASQGLADAGDCLIAMEPTAKQLELGAIMLVPGQRFVVNFDIRNNQLVNAKILESQNNIEFPGTEKSAEQQPKVIPNTIECSMSFNPKEKQTILKIQNHFQENFLYECSIQSDEEPIFTRTTVVPVRAGIGAYEMWPYKINKIMILFARLEPKSRS